MRKLSYLANTAFTFSVAEVLNRLVVLIALVIPARHYGVAQFGRLGAALAMTGIVIVVTNFIPVASLTRDLCQRPEQRIAIMANYLWQRLVVGAISTVLLGAAYSLARPHDALLAVLCYLYLYLLATAITTRAGLMARERFLAASLSSLAGSAILLTGTLLPVRSGLPIEVMCAGMAASQLLALFVVLGLLAFRGYPSREMLHQKTDWPYMWLELKRNAPYWLAISLIAGYNRSNAVLCQALRGDHEAGLFTAAFRIFEGFSLIATVYQQVSFPRMVRQLKTEHRTGDYLESSGRVLTVFAQFVSLLVTLGGFRLMAPFWGKGFGASGLTMQMLIWALTFNLVSYVLSHILVAENRTWSLMRVTLVAFATNIVANLLLISRYGASGAATATVLTEGVVLIGVLRTLGSYQRTWRVISATLRSSAWAGAIVVAGITASHLGAPGVAIVAFGPACYLIGVWALGILRRRHLSDVFWRLMPERSEVAAEQLATLPPGG